MIEVKSLVVILPLPPVYRQMRSKWLPIDDGNHEYVIRYVGPLPGENSKGVDDAIGVALEEGVICSDRGTEVGIYIEYVKEVQCAGEVNIEELMEESLYVTV